MCGGNGWKGSLCALLSTLLYTKTALLKSLLKICIIWVNEVHTEKHSERYTLRGEQLTLFG